MVLEGDESVAEAQGGDHERELADLTEHRPGEEGARPRLAEEPQNAHVERGLADGDDEQEEENAEQVRPDVVEVDEQPDRQEEQHQEHALDRPRRLDERLARGARADEQAGEERAVGRRQTQQPADRRRREARRQRRQRRQVAVADDPFAERQANALAAAQVPYEQHQEADRERHRQEVDQRQAGLAGHGVEHQHHRHHREVLGDQDADRAAADLGAQLVDVLEHLDRDGGARQRGDEAQKHRQLDRPAEELRQQHHHREAHGDLQRGAEERHAPHRLERAQAELHADQEQEHQHAELGEHVDLPGVCDQPQARRAEHHAGDDVADDRRLLEPRHRHAADQRDHRDQGDEGELVGRVHGAGECITNPPRLARITSAWSTIGTIPFVRITLQPATAGRRQCGDSLRDD